MLINSKYFYIPIDIYRYIESFNEYKYSFEYSICIIYKQKYAKYIFNKKLISGITRNNPCLLFKENSGVWFVMCEGKSIDFWICTYCGNYREENYKLNNNIICYCYYSQ
jgi:hypothetical protein